MPSSGALWRGYLSRNRKRPSARPKSRTYTNNSDAQMRIGGATNAVAGFSTPRNRSWATPGGLE